MSSSSLRSVVHSALKPVSRLPSVLVTRGYASKSDQAVFSTSLEDYNLPEIHLGHDHPNRYRQYYEDTLQEDLMYMTYNHRLKYKKDKEPKPIKPMNPYEINRPLAPPKQLPKAKAITYATIPILESITIHSMAKEAINNKQKLLNLIMAFKSISGEAPGGGGRTAAKGVEIIRAKRGAAAWSLREDMPIAAKVEIKGDAMYDFLQSLVDFVLPRIREYPGVPIPPLKGTHLKPNMVGSVVSFGLPPDAMGFFPQIEVNLDSYTKLHGFNIYFKTNMRGEHAEMWTRNLLSGFRVPFYRK